MLQLLLRHLRQRWDWGQELSDIDLELSGRAAYYIAGVVADPQEGGPCRGCTIRSARLDGSLFVTQPQISRVTREGTFLIRGLSAGSYKVFASKGRRVVRQVVQVDDRSVDDVALLVGSGQAVAGRVVFDQLENEEDGPDPEGLTIGLTAPAAPEQWPQPEADVSGSGSFVLQDVPAEDYRLDVFSLPRGAYLKALSFGGRPLPRPVIRVPEDHPLTGLQVVIAFDAATVGGQVKSSGSRSEGAGGRLGSGEPDSEARTRAVIWRNAPLPRGRRGSFSLPALHRGATACLRFHSAAGHRSATRVCSRPCERTGAMSPLSPQKVRRCRFAWRSDGSTPHQEGSLRRPTCQSCKESPTCQPVVASGRGPHMCRPGLRG